jgi:plastocyanin
MTTRSVGPLLLVVAFFAPSCGGGGSTSPTTPGTTTPTTTQAPAPSGSTVTITSAGVSPKQIEIAVGGRVTFVNNDRVVHEESSDPHPIHTDCPPINEVGALAPGQSRSTGAFATARTCGYHDHGDNSNPLFQGTIVIR